MSDSAIAPTTTKRKRVVVSRPSSGGCRTCRARRVKCDEARPHCQRCLLAGRQCLGYRDVTFKMNDQVSSQNLAGDGNGAVNQPLQPKAIRFKHIEYAPPVKRQYDSSVSISSPAIYPVNIRAMEQLQLLSNVVEHHLPTNRIEARWARRGSFLGLLPVMDLSSPLVSNAVDSLCFGHLASRTHDQRLAMASRIAYGKTLHVLGRHLMEPRRRDPEHRKTLYSIMAISLYDDSIPTEQRWKNDWEIHYWGVHQYLLSTGPSAFDLDNEFDMRLYRNLRAPMLWLTLARRKPLVFAQPTWNHLLHSSRCWPSDTEHRKIWYSKVADLPGMLAEADKLLCSSPRAKLWQLHETYNRMDKLREGLFEWMAVQAEKRQPVRVTLDDRDAFDMDIEEHAFITTSTVFEEFLDYNDTSMNNCVSTIWIMCLIIECTFLRFFDVPSFSASQPPGSKKTIEELAYRHASYLCTMAYAYCKLSALANAHYTRVFVGVARSFFDDFGAQPEADWCRDCMAATDRRIERMKKIEPPTMCRIGDLGMTEDLVQNQVRYRRERGWTDEVATKKMTDR